MDVLLIAALLLGVGLVVVLSIALLGELLLLLGLATTVLLDLGANLTAALSGHPRSHRYWGAG